MNELDSPKVPGKITVYMVKNKNAKGLGENTGE